MATLPARRSRLALMSDSRPRSETTSGYEERCALKEYQLDGLTIVPDKVIGEGAYGSVVEVKFRGLTCVGKKLHAIFFKDTSTKEKASILKRFEEECQILSKLRHPCIVQFLGIYYEPDSIVPILVMEYLHMTLSKCIDCYDALSDEIAYPILHDIALGLCYLHGHKPQPIIHRDLSANNVLLTADMRAKISDLGVARILNLSPSQKTQRQLTMAPGTPDYMPPEALIKHPQYNTKIDAFSYGVLLLHVFSGKWPIPTEPNRQDPTNPDKVVARTEAERREEYILEIGDHPLVELAKQCLHNNQHRRPSAVEIADFVEQKQCFIPPTFKNKADSVKWIAKLKEDNEYLHLQNAMLEKQSRIHHEEDAETSSLSSKELPLCLRAKSSSFSSASKTGDSINSLDQLQASAHNEVCHPYQPGAKLVWSAKCADLPVAMYHAHAITMNTVVYVGGGCTKGCDDIIFKYNLLLDNWDRLTPCPVSYFGFAQFGGRLAAIGGITGSKGISNIVYDYDENTQKWKNAIPPMLTARHSLTAIGSQLNLVACGGKDANGVTDKVEVYQAQSSQWFESYRLPFPCYHMSATVIHGYCYLLGGYDPYAFTDKVLYVPLASLLQSSSSQAHSKSIWRNLQNTHYSCAAAANIGGCLLAVGGVSLRSPKVCMYSPLKNIWTRLIDLQSHDAYLGPTVAELPSGELLIIGGANSKTEPQSVVYKGSIHYS